MAEDNDALRLVAVDHFELRTLLHLRGRHGQRLRIFRKPAEDLVKQRPEFCRRDVAHHGDLKIGAVEDAAVGGAEIIGGDGRDYLLGALRRTLIGVARERQLHPGAPGDRLRVLQPVARGEDEALPHALQRLGIEAGRGNCKPQEFSRGLAVARRVWKVPSKKSRPASKDMRMASASRCRWKSCARMSPAPSSIMPVRKLETPPLPGGSSESPPRKEKFIAIIGMAFSSTSQP